MFKSLFSKLFGSSKKPEKVMAKYQDMDPRDVPAYYWPETQHFIEHLKDIVAQNTIDDPQAQRMNAEMVHYIEKQIEKKSFSGTYQEKCDSLEMIADRVLSTTVNKLVGQKEKTTETTEFSNCINQFKADIKHKRESFQAMAQE